VVTSVHGGMTMFVEGYINEKYEGWEWKTGNNQEGGCHPPQGGNKSMMGQSQSC